ncbi:MAG: ribosome assembly RNA-binding protein YhbY [Andreesenia angusta]|nr:ribosome assembly RNA-binding protein YhbY [Andreesenia angusta]
MKGKQRSYLKSIANGIEPALQIGKSGLKSGVLDQIDDLLEAREIVKIKILNNCMEDKNDILSEICDQLEAEYVQSLGNKIVVYRESEENKRIELPK